MKLRFRLTWFKCTMARSYAVWTDLRTLGFLPSIRRSLSTVSSIPSGSSLFWGSHCLKTNTETFKTQPFTLVLKHQGFANVPNILPSSLCVEEEHQEELVAFVSVSPFPQFEHLSRRHWDGDAVVEQSFLRHVRVNDLQQSLRSAARLLVFIQQFG